MLGYIHQKLNTEPARTKNKQLTLEAFRRSYTDRKTKLEAASEAMSTGTGPAKAVAEAREQLDAVCTAIAETLFD